MKILKYLVIFAIIGLPAVAHAQAPSGKCPSISVSGPAGVTNPGDDMAFSATIEPFDPQQMTLVWKVTRPDSKEVRIKAGQGTRSIQVETNRETEINFTATLTLQGLPDGCNNTDSESAGVAVCFFPITADEYGVLKASNELHRLANITVQMENLPGSSALFIFSYPAATSRKAIESKNKEILRQLAKLAGISPDRIIFAYENGDAIKTKIFILPAGAEWPGNEASLDSFRPKNPLNKK